MRDDDLNHRSNKVNFNGSVVKCNIPYIYGEKISLKITEIEMSYLNVLCGQAYAYERYDEHHMLCESS